MIALAVVVAMLFSADQLVAASVDLRAEISRLAQQHGFRVDGDEHLKDHSSRLTDGPLYQQLRILLEEFDHIIIQDAHGGVERLLILGAKTTGPPPAPTQIHAPVESATSALIELPTHRQGNQHLVTIEIEGAGARRIAQELLIDTGADALVLSSSMISQLGLSSAALSNRTVQTANGRTQARYGRLPAVWLNGQRLPDVAVAFLDDGQLGSRGLLGMSVLGRFRMTIDDQNHQLLLEPR